MICGTNNSEELYSIVEALSELYLKDGFVKSTNQLPLATTWSEDCLIVEGFGILSKAACSMGSSRLYHWFLAKLQFEVYVILSTVELKMACLYVDQHLCFFISRCHFRKVTSLHGRNTASFLFLFRRFRTDYIGAILVRIFSKTDLSDSHSAHVLFFCLEDLSIVSHGF